jgi:hypothetical protein
MLGSEVAVLAHRSSADYVFFNAEYFNAAIKPLAEIIGADRLSLLCGTASEARMVDRGADCGSERATPVVRQVLHEWRPVTASVDPDSLELVGVPSQDHADTELWIFRQFANGKP